MTETLDIDYLRDVLTLARAEATRIAAAAGLTLDEALSILDGRGPCASAPVQVGRLMTATQKRAAVLSILDGEDAGLSDREIARRVGVSPQTVGNLRRRRAQPSNVDAPPPSAPEPSELSIVDAPVPVAPETAEPSIVDTPSPPPYQPSAEALRLIGLLERSGGSISGRVFHGSAERNAALAELVAASLVTDRTVKSGGRGRPTRVIALAEPEAA
jgi:DNA-binding CsgD family transcriptional regulator